VGGCSSAAKPDAPVAVAIEPGSATPFEERADDASPAPPEPKCGRVEAEEHFQRGRTLMNDGRWVEACGALEASNRCDRATGTLMNLGRCYEQVGDVARACERWREALAGEPAGDRRDFAADRVQQLGCR
jgi:hypothetical protein